MCVRLFEVYVCFITFWQMMSTVQLCHIYNECFYTRQYR